MLPGEYEPGAGAFGDRLNCREAICLVKEDFVGFLVLELEFARRSGPYDEDLCFLSA